MPLPLSPSANNFFGVLSAANPTIRLLANSRSLATPIAGKDLVYPCTVYVQPIAGSTISVQFNLSSTGGGAANWTAGNVTVNTAQVLNECPGDIVFNLVSGTGGNVGIT